MSFSARLREAIGSQSPAAVARAAGFTKQTMDGYLKGSMPSADRAIALADALDVPLRWLITGREEAAPLRDLDEDWVGLPQFPLFALRAGEKPVVTDHIPIHRDWLTRTAASSPNLWITQMPSSSLEGVPSEGDMIVCCDAREPHGEGLYLYRLNDVPIARRFAARNGIGVSDVSISGTTGMEVLGRILGAIKMQPAS